ncbi:DUF397 domain-containing protein [Streptomyces sp. NRRL F-2890]|uniref:DUF397 domain-containing protein n=1 Tax=Streptomyces sp. NRRL F-2890 TaxID=1463845 RepID=UPI0004C5B5E8|nr:DUF397 domain-containing protein [Streptomyces sp. NRRL F-2890]
MSAFACQKSSYSAEGANCVNVAAAPDGLLRLRESTDPGMTLTVRPAALRGLLRAIKADPGRLTG